uniref:Uncharacterized protein n=1 Tax=Setaria italica TaxID=4555 RepID=K3ZFZ4_SETIT
MTWTVYQNITFPPRVHFSLNANSFEVMILLGIFHCHN